jgi:hypothetical protein
MIHLDCWQIVPDFWLSQANIFSRLGIYSNFEDYGMDFPTGFLAY